MGTLSGGGKDIISVGERCLIGANGGLGISLGDDCVVEAGLYVTAGTRVTTPDGEVVKAKELSGADGLLFRRNSVSGTVEVLPRTRLVGRAQRRPARQRLTASAGQQLRGAGARLGRRDEREAHVAPRRRRRRTTRARRRSRARAGAAAHASSSSPPGVRNHRKNDGRPPALVEARRLSSAGSSTSRLAR